MNDEKAAEINKYFKFKISNSHKRYTISNIKKNLKNTIDLIKFIKFAYSYPSKYKDFMKFKLVEKRIAKNNKKIIFIGRLNLVVKIFDLKWKIPRPQNNITLILTIKFPKTKLIGKKAKTKFVNKTGLMLKFFLLKIIIILMIPQ